RDLLRDVGAGSVAVGPRPAGPSLARSLPFLAVMAQAGDPLRTLRHDLANPLAAILAETQLLLLNVDRFDAETVGSLKQIESLARASRGERNPSIVPASASSETTAPIMRAAIRPASTSASLRARSPGATSAPARRNPAPPAMKIAVSSSTPCPATNVPR